MTDAAPSNRTASTGPRYRPRTVLAAALVGVLVLATVIGVGWFLSAERRSARGAENRSPAAAPDNGWVNGAAVRWRTSIGTNREIVTAGNHLVAIERSTARDSNATLTGYTIGDDGPTESWTQTVDLSQGALDDPEFLPWGESTLVHGTTLINLNTGEVSSAPWDAQKPPLLADDIIVNCDSTDSCRAWQEGSTEPLWSAQVSGASHHIDSNLPSLLPTYVRRGNRYIVLNMRRIINLDTGKEVELNLPALEDYFISAASNGWAVAAVTRDHNDISHVYEFDIDGGDSTDSYAIKAGLSNRGTAFIYKTSPRSLSDYRTLWRDGDFSEVLALGHGDSKCTTSIEVLGGPTFDVPQTKAVIPRTPSGSAISASSSQSGCPEIGGFATSPDQRTLRVVARGRAGVNSFHFLYNLATGEAVSFEGIDATDNSQLELVRSDLALGYDPDDGEVYGFTPANSR